MSSNISTDNVGNNGEYLQREVSLKDSTAALVVWRPVGVAPEVNLMIVQATKHALVLKPWANIIRGPKQGLCPPKNFFKKNPFLKFPVPCRSWSWYVQGDWGHIHSMRNSESQLLSQMHHVNRVLSLKISIYW